VTPQFFMPQVFDQTSEAARRGQVELWFVDLNASGAGLNHIEARQPRLSRDDLAKIECSVTRGAASHRRAAHIALRLIIERMFGPQWRAQPFALAGTGKPYLDGLTGGFSLTHVDHYALVGVSNGGAIGVDLEPVKVRAVASERRQRIEAAALSIAHGARLPDQAEARFLQAWVRLEALAKCDGRGIGRLLTGLQIIGSLHSVDHEAATTYAAAAAEAFDVCDVALDPALNVVASAAVPIAEPGASGASPVPWRPASHRLPETDDALAALILSS
jgi:4'-phosphopantetheinyl transferase